MNYWGTLLQRDQLDGEPHSEISTDNQELLDQDLDEWLNEGYEDQEFDNYHPNEQRVIHSKVLPHDL